MNDTRMSRLPHQILAWDEEGTNGRHASHVLPALTNAFHILPTLTIEGQLSIAKGNFYNKVDLHLGRKGQSFGHN